MDIAALSMAMSQSNVQVDASYAILDKAMETAEASVADLTEMMDAQTMELSVNPGVGGNIDIKL